MNIAVLRPMVNRLYDLHDISIGKLRYLRENIMYLSSSESVLSTRQQSSIPT